MKKLLLTSFIIGLSFSLFGKKRHDSASSLHQPFAPGELLTYKAYYNWGFIWLDAANVSFSVQDTIADGKEAFLFNSKGISLQEYDWFFKVRDYYTSIAYKEPFQPQYFRRNTYEGGHKVDNIYHFNTKDGLAYMSTENSDMPLKLDTLPVSSETYDLLTAVYYARGVDYSKLKKDEKVPVTVISDGEIHNLYIRYKGIEEVETRESKVRYRCAKFTVLLIEGTIFNESEDMTIWVTDDDARIPVIVEAQILIGSVKAIIDSIAGNKYPLTSKITEVQ